jgi:glycosyltransferase involved in cell wall biosynthesis
LPQTIPLRGGPLTPSDEISAAAGAPAGVIVRDSFSPTGRPDTTSQQLTFVVLARERWNSPWLAHQPILAKMAERGHRALYLLPEYTIKQVLRRFADGNLPRNRLAEMAKNVYEVHPNPFLPRIQSWAFVNSLSTRARVHDVRRVLAQWDQRILYLWHPQFQSFVGNAGEALTVFHCPDYYPDLYKHENPKRSLVLRQFHELVERADLVLAGTEAVLQKVHELRREGVHLVENGVDFQRFRSFAGSLAPIPVEMQGLRRPIVGYIGRINRKVDLNIMIDMALRRPGWSLLLMGPIVGWGPGQEELFRKFIDLPNTLYIQGKHHTEIPRYMNGLDVGLMNYVTQDTWMSFGFPLKMFEYFAMGKPAVCNDLLSVRKYAPPLKVVADDGDWVAAVEEALSTTSDKEENLRVVLAGNNSWDHRCDAILQAVGARLQ